MMNELTPHQVELATLCYIRKDGKTLLLHRIKKANDVHRGKWNGLGGKLLQGESPEECVIREVQEESGLILQGAQLRGLLTFPAFSGVKDEYTFLYTAEYFSGELIDSLEGELAWIDDDRIADLPMWEGDKLFLEWLQQRHFFSAKLTYKEGRLSDQSVVFYP